MRVNKTQALLFIYTRLLRNRRIEKKEIISELEISNITFLHYIQELRAFFANFNLDYEVVYQKYNDCYVLVTSHN